MGLLSELQKTVAAFGSQLTHTSMSSNTLHFTRDFQGKAKAWGLTEADATDVYHHGQQVKDNMLVRKYNGYEIGIWYFKDSQTGQPVITSIWKRETR